MSAIDPRLIAWLSGQQGPADAAEARRRIAALERSAGVAAQNVAQSLQPQIDNAESLANSAYSTAAAAQGQILHAGYGESLGAPAPGGYHGRTFNWIFGVPILGGIAIADLQGNGDNIICMAQWSASDGCGVYVRVYAAGYVYYHAFGIPA